MASYFYSIDRLNVSHFILWLQSWNQLQLHLIFTQLTGWLSHISTYTVSFEISHNGSLLFPPLTGWLSHISTNAVSFEISYTAAYFYSTDRLTIKHFILWLQSWSNWQADYHTFHPVSLEISYKKELIFTPVCIAGYRPADREGHQAAAGRERPRGCCWGKTSTSFWGVTFFNKKRQRN